jgi:hypothetical protein
MTWQPSGDQPQAIAALIQNIALLIVLVGRECNLRMYDSKALPVANE